MSYDKCSSMSVKKNGDIYMSVRASNIFWPGVKYERWKYGSGPKDLVKAGMDMVHGNIHPNPSANKGKLLWFENEVRKLTKPMWEKYVEENNIEDCYFKKLTWIKEVLLEDEKFVDHVNYLWRETKLNKRSYGKITHKKGGESWISKIRLDRVGISGSTWVFHEHGAKLFNWFEAQNILSRDSELAWTREL